MSVRHIVLALGLCAAPIALQSAVAHDSHARAAAEAKPTPKDALLKPPADAVHYVVVSDAAKHGDQWRWQLPDGRTAYRWSEELRGWISEVDQVVTLDKNGVPSAMAVRGVTFSGDAAETFSISGGQASWTSTSDNGSAPADGHYLPAGGIRLANETLVNQLAGAGESGVALLPSGKATLSLGPTLSINGPKGAKTVQLAFVRGVLPTPYPVWLDENRRYFAEVGWISLVPAGYEAAVKAMRDRQDEATAEAVKSVAAKFLTPQARRPVLFDNVRLFDAEKGQFLANQAVLASDGKISRIGAAGSIAAPSGAQVIDGRGKTLVPGIWDSHMHIGDDWDVLANIANGMTSFRSPGTMVDRAQSVAARRANNQLLMGEPFVSVIIDKKDPLAAQGSETVSSEAEAIAAVRKISQAGLWGAKFYTSMNPAWIAPAAAEAKKLGLHVHGHVPASMRPSEAVRAGYDELTHLNFVVMEWMPKDVLDKANTRQRMEGPAKFFKDTDLDSAPVSNFIAELASRKTVIDPTIVLFEQMLTQDGGAPGPAYAPYMGIISPVLDRSFRSGGYPLVEGYSRDDYRKSFEKMVDLVGRLHKAGVPIVAGTDGSGVELIRELEIYQQAGMSAAEALQTATIVPARVVGADKRTGSIAIGKEADMVLVDGDVSTDLGALRRVVTVVSDGYVMDGDALRAAAGYSGRPK
ncbi:amidohydrolase family protein [Sphingomonas xanthus]|uniref:Amidohydrolase family protein n=1 Tax=Sphingomonas xanthus TaxID=2594473 RepID=A0A516IT27_9SPHN|nr:amidohydrolase family protein [Sphingomonas xanthus]QDP20061.1 amidohydrolase family protein [Sphingomonas xanthus]